jgi:hypothetical protein
VRDQNGMDIYLFFLRLLAAILLSNLSRFLRWRFVSWPGRTLNTSYFVMYEG